MTFPESPRVIYAEHTLSQVVCQLNFPPILAIGAQPPVVLQDRLREDYPLYETNSVGGPLQMPDAPPALSAILTQLPLGQPQTTQHRFTTADGTRSITVGPRLLAIEETQYTEWDALRAEIESARAALEAVYRPAFYTRIGLRYQDVLDRALLDADAPWADLITPVFLGLLGAEDDEIQNAVREIGSLVLLHLDGAPEAFVRINHGLIEPEDDAGRQLYVIDADYFTQERKEGSEVRGLLDYFNHEAGCLFRWAVTPALRDALGRRDDLPSNAEQPTRSA
jgi:uncharacterized protein (TIGR04255 family)